MDVYLLDTHALFWAMTEQEKLPENLVELITDKDVIVLFSQVSILELQIKKSLGKLVLKATMHDFVEKAKKTGFRYLDLSNEAIFFLEKLPWIHRDPFDRLLICETIVSKAEFVTCDCQINKYPVKTIWS